jgi:hypothetical protein
MIRRVERDEEEKPAKNLENVNTPESVKLESKYVILELTIDIIFLYFIILYERYSKCIGTR